MIRWYFYIYDYLSLILAGAIPVLFSVWYFGFGAVYGFAIMEVSIVGFVLCFMTASYLRERAYELSTERVELKREIKRQNEKIGDLEQQLQAMTEERDSFRASVYEKDEEISVYQTYIKRLEKEARESKEEVENGNQKQTGTALDAITKKYFE